MAEPYLSIRYVLKNMDRFLVIKVHTTQILIQLNQLRSSHSKTYGPLLLYLNGSWENCITENKSTSWKKWRHPKYC